MPARPRLSTRRVVGTCMRKLPLASLAALTLLLGIPAGADAALKSIWGPITLPDGRSAFPLYRQLGVDVWQEPLFWDQIAKRRPARPRDPNDPAYQWPAEADRGVADANRNKIAVALEVIHSPKWANGGRKPNFAPTSDADYQDFLIAATRRYPSVHMWMIWGEPTRKESFSPMPKNQKVGPERYATLLDASYETLKAESAANIVIGAMTFTVGDVKPRDMTKWMRLPNGLPPRLDWWGHNPFTRRLPRLSDPEMRSGVRDFSDLDLLIEEVRTAYAPRGVQPPLWLSEFSIQSDHGSPLFPFYTTREGQRRYVEAAYRIADQNPWIAGLGWVRLVDSKYEPRDINWGLLDRKGRKKPSYNAFFDAPSARFKAGVESPPVVTASALGLGVPLRIVPRLAGRVIVTLSTATGGKVVTVGTQGAKGVPLEVTLKAPGRTPGTYTVNVRSRRGERVTRPLQVIAG